MMMHYSPLLLDEHIMLVGMMYNQPIDSWNTV
jgi:hypothetical protein